MAVVVYLVSIVVAVPLCVWELQKLEVRGGVLHRGSAALPRRPLFISEAPDLDSPESLAEHIKTSLSIKPVGFLLPSFSKQVK